jgi:hypothetical protein
MSQIVINSIIILWGFLLRSFLIKGPIRLRLEREPRQAQPGRDEPRRQDVERPEQDQERIERDRKREQDRPQ